MKKWNTEAQNLSDALFYSDKLNAKMTKIPQEWILKFSTIVNKHDPLNESHCVTTHYLRRQDFAIAMQGLKTQVLFVMEPLICFPPPPWSKSLIRA